MSRIGLCTVRLWDRMGYAGDVVEMLVFSVNAAARRRGLPFWWLPSKQ